MLSQVTIKSLRVIEIYFLDVTLIRNLINKIFANYIKNITILNFIFFNKIILC